MKIKIRIAIFPTIPRTSNNDTAIGIIGCIDHRLITATEAAPTAIDHIGTHLCGTQNSIVTSLNKFTIIRAPERH